MQKTHNKALNTKPSYAGHGTPPLRGSVPFSAALGLQDAD